MWIEILTFLSSVLFLVVEARESLVDRNYCDTGAEYSVNVEARESLVDRNPSESLVWLTGNKSRLARALWIEILLFGLSSPPLLVEARESLVDLIINVLVQF